MMLLLTPVSSIRQMFQGSQLLLLMLADVESFVVIRADLTTACLVSRGQKALSVCSRTCFCSTLTQEGVCVPTAAAG